MQSWLSETYICRRTAFSRAGGLEGDRTGQRSVVLGRGDRGGRREKEGVTLKEENAFFKLFDYLVRKKKNKTTTTNTEKIKQKQKQQQHQQTNKQTNNKKQNNKNKTEQQQQQQQKRKQNVTNNPPSPQVFPNVSKLLALYVFATRGGSFSAARHAYVERHDIG